MRFWRRRATQFFTRFAEPPNLRTWVYGKLKAISVAVLGKAEGRYTCISQPISISWWKLRVDSAISIRVCSMGVLGWPLYFDILNLSHRIFYLLYLVFFMYFWKKEKLLITICILKERKNSYHYHYMY